MYVKYSTSNVFKIIYHESSSIFGIGQNMLIDTHNNLHIYPSFPASVVGRFEFLPINNKRRDFL